MTTKGWLVLFFLVVAIVLFLIVGFAITSWPEHDLVALGLAALVAAVVIHLFMRGPELTG